ncbi:MAG: T9SS type A sorting domain-containing protein [Candidatus Kapaibacterium sp.]
MENDLRKYLDLAGKYISQEKIFSEDELRSAIRKSAKYSKFKRLTIMATLSSAIIGIILSAVVFAPQQPEKPVPEISGQNNTNSPIVKGYDSSNDQNTISKAAEITPKQNIIEENPADDNTNHVDVFTIRQATPEEKAAHKELDEKYRHRIFKLNIEGLNMLEMSVEEFERIVPGFRQMDDIYIAYEEVYTNESGYERLGLDKYGYPRKFPLLVKRYNSFEPERIRFNLIQQYEGWDSSDYSRTLYPIVVFNGKNGHQIYMENESPLFRYGNELFKEFYEFNINQSMERWRLREANDTAGLEKNERYRTELQRLVYSRLIPVKMPRNEDSEFIFFFVPNEEFLAKVPERYRDQLRREIAIMNDIQINGQPAYEACKGFTEEQSYLDVCRQQSGALQRLSVFPNPAISSGKCTYLLSEERSVSLSIHDVNGSHLITVINNQVQSIGEQELILDLSDLENGIYLLAISTNRGEQVVTRLIVNK